MIPEYIYKILKHGKFYAVSRSNDGEKTITYLHRGDVYPNPITWESAIRGTNALFSSLITARGWRNAEQDKEELERALTQPELWSVVETSQPKLQ